MIDALFLGDHSWILPVPIVSTPFSCFPFVQELMLILRRRVMCFAYSIFKHLSSLIFQVSLVFVLGTLDSSFRHISDDKNVGGCFLNMLELGGGGLLGMVVSCAFSPFYQFGIMA